MKGNDLSTQALEKRNTRAPVTPGYHLEKRLQPIRGVKNAVLEKLTAWG
jgi:hypothetical protein